MCAPTPSACLGSQEYIESEKDSACVGDAVYHPDDGSHHGSGRTLFLNRFVFKS